MATEVETYLPQHINQPSPLVMYNNHYKNDSSTPTASYNTSLTTARPPPALDLSAAKQKPQVEITPASPSSPRPLPPEFVYQPVPVEKWRQSLDGNYTVTQRSLGEGASGKVILASDRRTNDVVAVKIVPKGRLRPDQLERIRREYSIMNQVGTYKHLVRLIEVIENPHEICIVMDYASDGDLFSLISGSAEERLSEDDARKIFRQVAKGVRYLHEHGFAHRDIKPENIFLSGGRALLGDFGYSMVYTDVPSTTSVGSLHYASPEVILKDTTYIGPEIDVWSLGCVLFAMVCGYTPFQGESVRDTKLAIVRGQVDYPSFLSAEVKSLISNMLNLNPKQRYTIEQVLMHEWTRKDKSVSPPSQTVSSHSADHEIVLPTAVDITATTSLTPIPESEPTTSPLMVLRSGAASIRARLPRLPLAKLRQLWHSDKLEKAGGRLSPTSPKSPLGSPQKQQTAAIDSNEDDAVPEQDASPSTLYPESDGQHSPSGGRPRRRNSSPRVLSSPRKALCSLTDMIMSPRRRSATAHNRTSATLSSDSSPRPATQHSDSFTVLPFVKRVRDRRSNSTGSGSSSSGEHPTLSYDDRM